MNDARFEPRIIGFLCNWCSYRAADLAGMSRRTYAPNIRMVRTMCSGRVDPMFVLTAFARGADGVMIAGCHPGECHYVEQNFKTMRRHALLTATLAQLGIERQRCQLVWASAAEAERLVETIDRIVEEVRELGPLDWPATRSEPPDYRAAVDRLAREHAEALEVLR